MGRVVAMPITEDQLFDLRLKYETAYGAYQRCVLALEEIWRGGEMPSAQLLEHHATALRQLNAERTRFRDALVQVAFLEDDDPSV
jgi:hypothetical protein